MVSYFCLMIEVELFFLYRFKNYFYFLFHDLLFLSFVYFSVSLLISFKKNYRKFYT